MDGHQRGNHIEIFDEDDDYEDRGGAAATSQSRSESSASDAQRSGASSNQEGIKRGSSCSHHIDR